MNDLRRLWLSPLEQQRGAMRYWRERGYADAKAGRERLSREELRGHGGELALRMYFEGFRRGEEAA